MNFYGRDSMRFSGVVSLISLSGCSRFALFFYLSGLSCCTWVLLVGGSFVGGFSPPAGLLVCRSSHLVLYVIKSTANAKWSRTAGEYSMGFKVQISSEQKGVPLEKYSNNHDTQLTTVYKR